MEQFSSVESYLALSYKIQVSVAIFNEWGNLLYVARTRDTDEEALLAAKRRGIELGGIIVIKRVNPMGGIDTRRYAVYPGKDGKLVFEPLHN